MTATPPAGRSILVFPGLGGSSGHCVEAISLRIGRHRDEVGGRIASGGAPGEVAHVGPPVCRASQFVRRACAWTGPVQRPRLRRCLTLQLPQRHCFGRDHRACVDRSRLRCGSGRPVVAADQHVHEHRSGDSESGDADCTHAWAQARDHAGILRSCLRAGRARECDSHSRLTRVPAHRGLADSRSRSRSHYASAGPCRS